MSNYELKRYLLIAQVFRVMDRASLRPARSLSGDWTPWRVVSEVALCSLVLFDYTTQQPDVSTYTKYSL